MSWTSHSLKDAPFIMGPKSSPFYLLEVQPRRGMEGPTSPRLGSTLSWTSFAHVPWWIQALAMREHTSEKGEMGSRCKTWHCMMKARRSSSHWMQHRWGSLRRAVWGGRDLIKDTPTQDERQQDGMAFVKIRGKEVPTQGFGGADGLERACCRGSVCKARSQNWTQMLEIIWLSTS